MAMLVSGRVSFAMFWYVLRAQKLKLSKCEMCHRVEAMIIGAEALEVPGVFTTEGLKIPVERQQDMTSLKLT